MTSNDFSCHFKVILFILQKNVSLCYKEVNSYTLYDVQKIDGTKAVETGRPLVPFIISTIQQRYG